MDPETMQKNLARLLPASAAVLAFFLAATLPAQSPTSAAKLEELPAVEFGFEEARHLLFRAGFGGSPEEVQRMQRLGLEGMVEALLDYEDVPRVVGPIEIAAPSRQDFARLRRLDEDGRRKLRNELRRTDRREFGKLRAWWMERMLRTRRPLEERMTLFWHGHFTSSYRDVRNAHHMHAQNETLREHATGNFRELLHAISKDPAMLEYLDNNRNRKGRPNENYAREVMELFTLGIGQYSEADIKEAARSFTGWNFDRFSDKFRFIQRQHDAGSKTVLGTTGRLKGEDTLDILLAHEACAPYVAKKIWEYLAYADPDSELVARLGSELRAASYELRPLLRKILMSREFYSERSHAAQVKSPVVLLVSTVRSFGMNPPPAQLLLAGTTRLGQDVMMPPNVKGWEGGLSWITTATLLDRYNLCGILLKAGQETAPARARGRQRGEQAAGGMAEMMQSMMSMQAPRGAAARYARMLRNWDPGLSASSLVEMLGVEDAGRLVDALSARYLLVPLPAERRRALVDFVAGQDGTQPLDFAQLSTRASEHKLRQLLHLLVSTPEYQVL
jgi:uncharacterized protein (DUF1800 family)